MFQILENDLVNFNNYIPIDYYLGEKRKDIFSPKLSELLIRIGSQIDIFFRNWDLVQIKNSGILSENLNFRHYKEIDLKLDERGMILLSTDEKINPFSDWKRITPGWWTAYNHIKHNGFESKNEGNLFNVIESLSALFLINCINKETKEKLIEYGYYNVILNEIGEIKRQDGLYIPEVPLRSQLFQYVVPPRKSLFDF